MCSGVVRGIFGSVILESAFWLMWSAPYQRSRRCLRTMLLGRAACCCACSPFRYWLCSGLTSSRSEGNLVAIWSAVSRPGSLSSTPFCRSSRTRKAVVFVSYRPFEGSWSGFILQCQTVDNGGEERGKPTVRLDEMGDLF